MCVFTCLPKHFPHHGWEQKKKKREESRTNRWKRFQAQEGKHFGEVCLWTQFKIIIGKTQAYSKAWVGWTLFVRCCERKSFSCCNTELCSCCCFFCGLSRCLPLMTYTDLSVSPLAGLGSVFGFVRDSVEKQDGVWTWFMRYFMCLNISPYTWGAEGKEEKKKRKHLSSSVSV